MQSEATIGERLGIVRPQRQRAVVARQRLREPLQLLQGVAPIGERLGIVRPQRERAVVARQRLREPLQLVQSEAAIIQGKNIIGISLQGRVLFDGSPPRDCRVDEK